MGKIFTLDADVKAVIQDALDDLITELGKDCRLVYPPRWVSCVNCVYDQIGGKSSNRWKTGGPMQFAAGTACPLCNGKGKRGEEVSETIRLLCAWDPRAFWLPVPTVQVRVPHSIVQTKGYLTDMPKVMKADHLVVELPIEPFVRVRVKLASQPVDPSNIIQARYFVATWEQNGKS